jgi:hypothetical protein
MLHKEIKILPPQKEKIFISAINNIYAQSGYNMNSRSIKIKDQEKFFINFKIFNQTKFKDEKVNYPNLWMELNILDDKLKVIKPKFKIIKEMGVIIKKKEINFKKFNFEIVLRNKREILDEAIIFVV